MLNRRLYLQAWLVALVALLVAFLTLEPPPEDITPELVTTFNGTEATRVANDLGAVAPTRAPGTPNAEKAAEWVEARLRELPGGDKRVASQDMVARIDGATVPLRNIFFTLPADAETRSQRNIVVVAPRDTRPGVVAGTSSTGIMLEMARTASKGRYRHPLIFVSADGTSLGNAGARWYLNSVDPTRIAGVVVLDAPAEGSGPRLHIWSSGAGQQSLSLRQLAERAVRGAGVEPEPLPPMRGQLLGLAVPETRGDQRAAIDENVPAVTIADRPEGELTARQGDLSRDRVDAAGTAALGLVNLLDARERANAPDASLVYAGKILRPTVARIALLLFALPLLVMALDAAARVRRARVRLSAGMRAVAWRFVTPLCVLFLAHLLAMWGVLRLPDIGRPPSASDLTVDLQAGLAVAFLALVSFLLWSWVRPRVVAAGANPPAEAAAALVCLAVITLVAWVIAPFSLVLILPAAHAALAATGVHRRWQLAALGAVAIIPLLAVVFAVSGAIDRNPLFTVWYLCQTAVSGARGLAGPVLAVAVGVCVVSLGTLVAFRARKGLVTGRTRTRPVRPGR